MRILLLAPHPFYIDRGTPIDVDLVLRGLSQRGDRVDVLTYHVGDDREYPGVTIHRIRAPRRIRHVPPGMSLNKLVCDSLLLRRAWTMVRENDYDVVHAGEESVFVAWLLQRVYGIPYIYDMDSSLAQQTLEQLPFLRPLQFVLNALEGVVIRDSLAAAPVCNALADLATRRGAPFIETLHDISQLQPADLGHGADLKQRLDISAPVVMYVGNLAPYQGIDLFLQAAARASSSEDFALVIAGGPDSAVETYREKSERLGIADRAHFIGPWPADRLGELLAEADVLVVPRIRGVNTPMKVFPFLHSGKPVLVTDLPTHTQILDSSVAQLAPADPPGFADGLIRLLRDPSLRRRLGEAGRAFVEAGHTWPAYRTRMDRLYGYVERQLDRTRPDRSDMAVEQGAARRR